MITADKPVRILSYNIRLTLERGIPAIVDTIRHINADIVALQEVGDHWPHGPDLSLTEHLAEKASYAHRYFAGALSEGDGAYGIAVLSRWPLTEIKKEYLPARDDEQRVVLKLSVDGPDLRIWNTHLSIERWDRNEQLKWLQQFVHSEAPDMVVGDLNTHPDDPELRQIPLKSSWTDYPAATYPSSDPKNTIDHILHGDRWAVIEPAQVFRSDASDHLPVFAVFTRTPDV